MTIADLFEGSESVFVNKTTTVRLSELRSALRGGSFDIESLFDADGRPAMLNHAHSIANGEGRIGTYTLADERAARTLNRSDNELISASLKKWGRTLSAERDARAGRGASPQRLGRVTRTLLDELREHWPDGDD
ncbi:MAG: hypothetical protein L6367_17825 [Cellulomonas sp.]|nr:hypothetical protein [Cellulomonas sp.]